MIDALVLSNEMPNPINSCKHKVLDYKVYGLKSSM
jgi:hypothetical protein